MKERSTTDTPAARVQGQIAVRHVSGCNIGSYATRSTCQGPMLRARALHETGPGGHLHVSAGSGCMKDYYCVSSLWLGRFAGKDFLQGDRLGVVGSKGNDR